jgi:hypothetical protein
MRQHCALLPKRRCLWQILFCLQAALVAFWLPVAEAAPRNNERQPALDYHQPVVEPAENQTH